MNDAQFHASLNSSPGTMSRDELNEHLENSFHPAKLGAETFTHPVTGYELPHGTERHLVRPPEGQSEAPAEFQVNDYGAGRMGQFRRDTGREPVGHVYRGMSDAEWTQAQDRGYIQSDQRGTFPIPGGEGTNAATHPDSAVSYLPMGGSGHIAKIRVDPRDAWFSISSDSYVRSRGRIPLDRVEATIPLAKDESGRVLK